MGLFDKIKKSLKQDKVDDDPELKALKKKIDEKAKVVAAKNRKALKAMGIWSDDDEADYIKEYGPPSDDDD